MNIQHIVTKEDLQDFKQEILEAIDTERPSKSFHTNTKRWLRTKEVAAYLSISTTQVHNLKSEGTLRCKKLGGTNFYDKNEIDDYLENQEVDLI